MGLKEINEAPGHTDTGLMDKNQKLRKQKDVQENKKVSRTLGNKKRFRK